MSTLVELNRRLSACGIWGTSMHHLALAAAAVSIATLPVAGASARDLSGQAAVLCAGCEAEVVRVEAEPDPGSGGSRILPSADLPAALEEGSDAACPFVAADPVRLARLLGVAGVQAIRAEAPFRRAQLGFCAR